MKLSIPFVNSKSESSIYYLVLLLTSEKTSAVILEESQGKIKIINRQVQTFANSVEELSIEELIETIDRAISQAVEVMPADIEIRKTVFGVKADWVEEETKKIKKIYLQKLKKVCDSLELTPIGFVVVKEAITNLMQQEEGAPLSAIFVELGGKIVTLTLLRGGKNVQILDGPVGDNYADSVDALLKHFTIEVLPARIILFDSEISSELVQKFIGHQWSKSLPFLHMPQISVLPAGFDARAVAAGLATQMGFEMLDNDDKEIKTFEHGTGSGHTKNLSHESDPDDKQLLENFGFVAGKDVAETVESKTSISARRDPSPSESESGQAMQSSVGLNTGKMENNDDNPGDGNKDTDSEEINNEQHTENNFSEKSIYRSKIGGILGMIKLPSIGFPSVPSFWFKVIFIPILIIGVLIGAIYYLYFNKVSATVIVTLNPKNVSQTQNVVFALDASNDFSNNILAAKQIDGTIDGDMTIGATGKKDVGDKAHGTVTIYNNSTDSDVTLSAGSALKSDNGLGFVLDKEVTVASASGDIFSGTKPGTANVNVTASEIGTNYNLPSGTKFNVGSNNSLAGKNDSAFSGGSKKAVTVVSKEDLAKLKTDLIKNLEDKASTELAKKSQGEREILPIVLSTSEKDLKYDRQAGDEAKTVKLIATISFTGLSYQNVDETNFAKDILTKKYAKDMNIDEDSVDVSIKDAKKESASEITATFIMDASLLPKIETEPLEKQFSGKPRQEVDNIISHLPGVADAVITYTPNISFLARLLPRLPNNVNVTLSSN